MGYIQFLTSLVMIGLFGFALITFVGNVGVENDASVLLSDDSAFATYSGKQSSNLSAFRGDADSSVLAFSKTNAEGGDEVSESGQQFKVTSSNALGLAKNTLGLAYTKVFGEGSQFSVVLTAILSLMVTIIGLLLYKAWFGRNPE